MSNATDIVIVMAKAPVPGKVKTRLCPPMSPAGAARLAASALQDTLDTVSGTPNVRKVLVLAGSTDDLSAVDYAGFEVVTQHGDGFDARLRNAFADVQGDVPARTMLVGMDTPQLRPVHLRSGFDALHSSDCAIGMALDGGWWTLAVNDAADADALIGVPMSTERTGELTVAALKDRGLTVAHLDVLVDVDTIEDATAVASQAPDSRFAKSLHNALTGGGE